MLSFENDYSEGAHEKILERLIATNRESCPDMEQINIVKAQKKRSGQPVHVPRHRCHFWWEELRPTSLSLMLF